MLYSGVSAAKILEPRDGYMCGLIEDAIAEKIASWIRHAQNLTSRIYDGYELRDGVDGNSNPDRVVSLAVATGPVDLPEHMHIKSDALLIIISGSGFFLSGRQQYTLIEAQRIAIPRGMPHGFKLSEGEILRFISIQSPPIRDPHTGEEDFHVLE